MTKISKEKANSGGKATAKVPKTSKLSPPKKVRTDYAMKQANEENSEQPSGSGKTSVSTQVPDSQLCCFNLPVTDDCWSISMLATMCSIHRGRAVRSMQSLKKRYGNSLYLQWDDDMEWPIAARFDSTHSVSGRKILTWEFVFYRLYSESKQQWPIVEKSIRDALEMSYRGKEVNDFERNWYLVVQSLVMGIVASDPLQFFDHSSPSYRGKSYSRFWDKSDPSNPRLLVDSRPLAKFWVLCCELLGHPWVDPNSTDVPPTLSENHTRSIGRHWEVDRDIREQFSMGKRDAPPRVRSMLAEPFRTVLGRSLDARIEWLCLASRERTRYRRSLVRQRRMIHELRSRRSPSSARPLGTST